MCTSFCVGPYSCRNGLSLVMDRNRDTLALEIEPEVGLIIIRYGLSDLSSTELCTNFVLELA